MFLGREHGTQTFENVHSSPIDFWLKWDILHTISFGRDTMKLNSMNMVLGVCLGSVLLLGGCKDKNTSGNDAAGEMPTQTSAQATRDLGGSQNAATPQAGSSSASSALPPVLAQDPTLKISQSSTGERIIQSAPAVAPPASYSPSSQDVQGALVDVLVSTVSKMPDSPQRNQYYQQQANVLQTLKVSQCGQAPVGQPVVCNISLGNKTMQIKLLFTNVGWAVVK